MKKIFIICTIILTLGITNVNAAESCDATRQSNPTKDKELSFRINGQRRIGHIYIVTMNGNGKSSLAFCLNRGKRAASVYAKTTTSGIKITNTMRKAYAFVQNVNISTPGGEMRYIIAQIAIWLDQEGALNTLSQSASDAIMSFYEIDVLSNARIEQINKLIQDFYNTKPYTGQLYVYASKSNPSQYQYFLAGLDMPTCPKDPTKTYCPSPYETIDITDCVKSQDLSTCVSRYCPAANTCNGYATKIVGNGAVCANDDSNNIGYFYEEVDTSECGDADEDGYTLDRPIGEYCDLYCKEEVTQSYPGGISNPISLGTNIVWPTSSATQNTVWKNLYSLSYRGIKTCKVVIKPKANIDDKLKEINSGGECPPGSGKLPGYDGCWVDVDKTCIEKTSYENCGIPDIYGQRDACARRYTVDHGCRVQVPKKSVSKDAILDELNKCFNYNYSAQDLYNFQSSTQISYDDNEFGATYQLVGNTNYSCEGCASDGIQFSTTSTDVDKIYKELNDILKNKVITVTAEAFYQLPTDDSIYKYVSKKTNLPLKSPIGEYINIGYSFLPTSYNAAVGKKYNLKIYVNSLGENGKFTDVANNAYTCTYTVSNISTNCLCPIGTKHAGEDLSSLLTYNNGAIAMTCADAQLTYCGDGDGKYFCPDGTDVTDCINQGNSYSYCCPSSNPYCPDGTSLVPCMSTGESYEACYAQVCETKPPTDDYYCPNGKPGDEMDGPLHDCVASHMYMGFDAAVQYCKDVVCPGGIRIIYRTISLRNPFPGKTAGVNVSNTTIDFSLDNLKGRYPGFNWNSVELVEKQILYNRGVEGDKVYEKEPLYTFILDANTIKEIRKYNDQQERLGGYADFTLDCNSSGFACISNDFVRNAKYGIVSGICSNASHSNFYSCSES